MNNGDLLRLENILRMAHAAVEFAMRAQDETERDEWIERAAEQSEYVAKELKSATNAK